MGLADPGLRAICSDAIDAAIRGVGQEGTGTHMLGGRSGDASPESLSPRAGLLDQTAKGKMKDDAQSCGTDRKPTTS